MSEPFYHCEICPWEGWRDEAEWDPRLAGYETTEDMECPECGGEVYEL